MGVAQVLGILVYVYVSLCLRVIVRLSAMRKLPAIRPRVQFVSLGCVGCSVKKRRRVRCHAGK